MRVHMYICVCIKGSKKEREREGERKGEDIYILKNNALLHMTQEHLEIYNGGNNNTCMYIACA